MDRNKKRVTYMTGANSTLSTYGMNDRKKKKKPMPQRLRMLLALAVLAAVIILAVFYALSSTGRESVGRVTRIGATLSQNVTPFGDSVIFYDGTTLHCMAATRFANCPSVNWSGQTRRPEHQPRTTTIQSPNANGPWTSCTTNSCSLSSCRWGRK